MSWRFARIRKADARSCRARVYLLAAPIIHLVHGRPGRALGSLALRAGIPVVTGALLLLSAHRNPCSNGSSDCNDWSALVPAAIGLIGGAAVASVLDTSLLAKGDDPPARSWGPGVAPTRGGVTLGVAGSF